jgi:membrane associated rhomboid family serine protease
MFLIPTGTDREDGRKPFFVPLLVVACIACFLLTGGRPRNLDALEQQIEFLERYALSYEGFKWWQVFTYQFLHGGWFHLLSNMFFLAAFGVVLESRLGRFGFLAIYLAGGAVAGVAQAWIGHWLAPSEGWSPIIGASGSTSALLGAVFALYPRGNVRGIAIPQFMPAQTSIQWMMAFAIAVDVVRTIVDWSGAGNSGIATLAHLGGILFGFAIGIALLACGLLRRDDADMLFLMKQWWRRREMRLALESAGTGGASGTVAGRVRADAGTRETDAQQVLRGTIAAAHRERDYALAADLYAKLLRELPAATLPAGIQLDVANELARSGRHALAAQAYGRFVERFRTHPACDDVRLLLASIEGRRLGDPAAALRTLDGLAGRPLDDDRARLAAELRAECEAVQGTRR